LEINPKEIMLTIRRAMPIAARMIVAV